MVQVRLRSPHYLNNRYYEEGSRLDVPESALSIEMEGLDEEAEAAVKKHINSALNIVDDHGTGGVNIVSLPNHPIVVKHADGTFGDPAVVEAAKSKAAEDVPQTTLQPPAKPKLNDGGKPVFPVGTVR